MADGLSFDECLTTLLGMLGDRVDISIWADGVVAFFGGKLLRSENRGPSTFELDINPEEFYARDSHFFVVEAVGNTGFFLDPTLFKGARVLSESKHDLMIDLGTVRIGVNSNTKFRAAQGSQAPGSGTCPATYLDDGPASIDRNDLRRWRPWRSWVEDRAAYAWVVSTLCAHGRLVPTPVERAAVAALKRAYSRWSQPGWGSTDQCASASLRLIERLPQARRVWVDESAERSTKHVLVQLPSGPIVDLTRAQFDHRELPEWYASATELHRHWWRYAYGDMWPEDPDAWTYRDDSPERPQGRQAAGRTFAPTDAGSSRCVAHTKHNLGPRRQTVRFALDTKPVQVEDVTQDAVFANLSQECAVTAAAMLAHEQGHEDAGQSKEDKAARWLYQRLENGPVAVRVLRDEAKALGHAWRTVERAKKDAGVAAFQAKGTGGWTWELPGSGLVFG